MYARVAEKRGREEINLEDEEAVGSLCRLSGRRSASPKSAMEQEKRIRREIANSNERRRMQSINAGFASLKTLLPHQEGEKLSKASILQQTADYIYQLEQEKTRLLAQNCQLKRLLNQHHHSDVEASPSGAESPNDDRSTNTSSPLILSTIIPDQNQPSSGIEMVLDTSNQFQSSKNERPLNGEVRTDLLRTELLKSSNKSNSRSRSPKPDLDGSSTFVKVEESVQPMELDQSDDHIREISMQESGHEMRFEHKIMNSGLKAERSSPAPTPSVTLVKDEPCIDIDSPAIQKYAKMILKGHNNGAPVSSGRGGSISMLNNSTTYAVNVTDGAYTSSNFRISASQSTAPGTIVTVLPSSKCDLESLPPVLELHSINESGGNHVQSKADVGGASVSRRSSNFSNGTVDLYIVNSSPSNCQKSLDTICEAIRHLEGDHMFPQEERHHHLMEEEVITEEDGVSSFTVDSAQQRLLTLEEQQQQSQPQQHHHHHPIVVNNGYQFEAINTQDVVIDQHGHHHMTVAGGGTQLTVLEDRGVDLTLPLIEEPQEAPLELTTTHRGSSIEHHNYGTDLSRGVRSHQHQSTHSSSSLDNVIHLAPQSSTRPGVIVVQQP